ncbi:hypothetical protein FI667_g5498, partial [Globisporangium splendens]
MPSVETGGDPERVDALLSAAVGERTRLTTDSQPHSNRLRVHTYAPLLQYAVMSTSAIHDMIALIPRAMSQTAKKMVVAFHRARPELLQLDAEMASKQHVAKKRLTHQVEHEFASCCRAASNYAQGRLVLERTIEEEEAATAEIESDIKTLCEAMTEIETRNPHSLLEAHHLCLRRLEEQLADCRSANEQRKRVAKLFEKAEVQLCETIGALVDEIEGATD